MSWAVYHMRRTIREGMQGVRGLVYLAMCVAALVSFAVLMPALEYQHVRANEVSNWDVWVTGPLSGSDIQGLVGSPDVGGVVPAISLGLDQVSGPRTDPTRSNAAGSVTALAYRSASELDDGPYPRDLLLHGTPPADGELACDWNVARRFRLSVGDIVRVAARPLGGSIEYRGRLAGIYGPTGLLKDSIAMPADKMLLDVIDAAGGSRWTDAFVLTAASEPRQAERIADTISTGPDSDRLIAVPRAALEQETRARLLQEVGPFFRSAASWVAVAGFAALALWQQNSRLSRRHGEYALLTALGMSRTTLAVHDGLEQATRLGIVAVTGIAAALVLVQDYSGLYVPRGALIAAAVAVLATVTLTLAVGAASMSRRLARMDLAQILAQESIG